MNAQIKAIGRQAGFSFIGDGVYGQRWYSSTCGLDASEYEKLVESIVSKVLDEVATRAFVSGDRAWSDDVDRQWVELQFGIGKLSELKNDR